MSKLDYNKEEKNFDNFSNLDDEEESKEYDNIVSQNKEDNIELIFHKNKNIKKVGSNVNNINNITKGKKLNNQRLSCQPVYKKRKYSHYSIKQTRTRKKTTSEKFLRNKSKNDFFSPLTSLKSGFLGDKKSIRSIKLKKNEEEKKIINNNKENTRNNVLKTYRKLSDKNILQSNGYIKKLTGKLNIYERAKKNLLRKKNYIKKKQALQDREINENLKNPKINRNSQKIIKKKTGYIPIQYRASEIYRKHILKSLLNEKKIKTEKIEEENKEYDIIRQYANKKSFNERDWDKFIRSQEYWNKIKLYKAKAAEIFRDNIEHEVNYIPEIDSKSKQIITDLRKNTIFVDDIHTRLYNDFDDLQERKKMRMSISMPSFKPLLNKSFKKTIFNLKTNYNNNKKKYDTKFKLLIEKKINSKYKIENSNNPTKYTSKSFINNNKNHKDFNFNSSLFQNISRQNYRKSRYDENYFDDPIFISKNYGENINFNKSQNKSKRVQLYNKNNKKRNNINNKSNLL